VSLAEVEFHSGVNDKLGFVCRLLRKAYLKGAQVAVRGSSDELARLDAALWSFEPREFVPHVRLKRHETPRPQLARTPLWLLDAGVPAPHHEVLVNLGPQLAEGFETFARVIEVVSNDAEDRDAGRRRWRAYEAQGIGIKHHKQPGTA
jgi:DNA polymerase-3 subunit chi